MYHSEWNKKNPEKTDKVQQIGLVVSPNDKRKQKRLNVIDFCV